MSWKFFIRLIYKWISSFHRTQTFCSERFIFLNTDCYSKIYRLNIYAYLWKWIIPWDRKWEGLFLTFNFCTRNFGVIISKHPKNSTKPWGLSATKLFINFKAIKCILTQASLGALKLHVCWTGSFPPPSAFLVQFSTSSLSHYFCFVLSLVFTVVPALRVTRLAVCQKTNVWFRVLCFS